MKKYLQLLIILTSLFSVTYNAQDYVPMPIENAQWSIITETEPDIINPVPDFYSHHAIVGDTLINDTLYQLVGYSNGGNVFNPETSWGIVLYREDDNRTVWGREDGIEYVKFDFNLEEGDEFCFYNQSSVEPCHEVVLVDSIMVQGSSRKRIHFQDNGQQDIWIEGIGSATYGISGAWNFIGNFETTLNCFNQNGNQIYGDCNIPSGLEEITEAEYIVLAYPNPVEDKLRIDSSSSILESFNVTIFDVFGRIVLSIPSYRITRSIDVSPLDSGIYSLVLEDDTKKLIKTNFVKN